MIIKQLFIILAALFLGHSVAIIFNIPIPSNVMGLVILFTALCIGIIKIKQVDKVSDFIIRYLAVFFVAPTVGIMQYFELIGNQFFYIIVPLILSILIGFFIAAKTTEIIIRIREKSELSAGGKGLGGEDVK
ncbi:MAG: CidA/LrgA family protein [Eubacteriales bacterium]|nr:CidA/LrgA family protein [Eubacteriales bacterium]MDD3199983.1 CidA/LrgA family protein [Eubacteriales bacterium]MDD4122339.1 CidA/LrgA family protein [Eubacteriales bacterium]MDD4630194.1 CidA/LrgA family protein [Eubacteriales bacterium]